MGRSTREVEASSGSSAGAISSTRQAVESVDSLASEISPSVVKSSRAVSLKHGLMLADAISVTIGIILAFQFQFLLRPVPQYIAYEHLALLLVGIPCFALGAGLNRLYQARANERQNEELWNIVKSVGVSVGGLVIASFVMQYGDLSRLWVFLLAACMTLALVVERQIARNIFTRMRSTGQLSRRIVIVGTDAHAIGLMHAYQRNSSLGYTVIGFVGDDDLGERGGVDVLGAIADISRILHEQDAVGVVVSLASVASDDVNVFARRLTDEGYHVALSSSLRDIDVTRLRPQQLDGRTMIYIEPTLRDGWRGVAKRVFDVMLASILLLLSAPLFLAGMIAVKLDSEGPVFFSQTRVGKNGRTFRLTKLRTMVVDAEERKAGLVELNEVDGPLFKIRDDPRITRVGSVLRKLSIDELPQLFCVLSGAMSMVGPRPALPDEVEQWDDAVTERLRVLPGLTGMWQVSGRSESTFEEYKRLDLYYVDNWSLGHDVRICAKTVGVVLSGSGAS
jgi:exopolysaccharide biosynthesis polyprenyl glycosylphosphotransferase